MSEYRLTFAFLGISQREFNSLAKRIDAFVYEQLDVDYEVYATPGGPSEWADSDDRSQMSMSD